MKKYMKQALMSLFLMATATSALAQTDYSGYFYVYKGGASQYMDNRIDSIILGDDGKIHLYDTNRQELYAAPRTQVDSISLVPPKVKKATILDVVFRPDGTATDVSPRHKVVEKIGDVKVSYNETYKRYFASFYNSYGLSTDAATGGFYKVDFQNDDFYHDHLADGHTLECLFMVNNSGQLPNTEMKPFSGHQFGGTGFVVTRKGLYNGNDAFRAARGWNDRNEITFLPNVKAPSETGGMSTYKWALSGVVPENQRYYHVVGVWNKEEGKARIYVNGEKKWEIDAAGDLHFPDVTANHWFGIGGDPNDGEDFVDMAFRGSMAICRIYDEPLNDTEVSEIWNEVDVVRKLDAPTHVVADGGSMASAISSGLHAFMRGANLDWAGELDAIKACLNDLGTQQQTKLMLDVWNHDAGKTSDKEKLYIAQIMEAVKTEGGVNHLSQVEFICNDNADAAYIVQTYPGAFVMQRNGAGNYGDARAALHPDKLAAQGIKGIYYTQDCYRCHPDYVLAARKNGMKSYVFNIDGNDKATQHEMASLDIDYIQTSSEKVAGLTAVLEEYAVEHTTNPAYNPAFANDQPVANLLDIRFDVNGKARDYSPMHHPVKKVWVDGDGSRKEEHDSGLSHGAEALSGKYAGKYAGKFTNRGDWSGDIGEFFKVDYMGDVDFMAALADGHTIELIFTAEGSFYNTTSNQEQKMFSSHQSGGTGFLITNNTDPNAGGHSHVMSFLPNVSENGNSNWVWTNDWAYSQYNYAPGTYYHLVGVWDKKNHETRFYTDTNPNEATPQILKAKKSEVYGNFVWPDGCGSIWNTTDHDGKGNDNRRWFGIGVDPEHYLQGAQGGKWKIVTCKIYDKPLTDPEARALFPNGTPGK